MHPYTPIDCSFYDRIEAAIVRRQRVTLLMDTGDSASDPVEVSTHLLDVWSEDGAEWVSVEDHGRLRADQVLALDGVARPGSAACTL